jgi:hypothetical protein
MVKIPDFCCSHTVKGTATVQMTGTSYSGPVTVPEGVYWNDPIYGQSPTPPSLGARLMSLMDALNASTTSINLFDNNTIEYGAYTLTNDTNLALNMAHANVTAEGRRIAKRIGINGLVTTLLDNAGNEKYHGVPEGYWFYRSRAEASKMQEDQDDGNAGYSESDSGFGFTFRMGNPAKSYLLGLRSVPETYTWSRGQVQSGLDVASNPYDLSFEARVWQYLARGEMVRIYTDSTATRTYTTAAMTAASTSVTVSSGTGLATGDKVCIDGEWCYVSNKAGTTLTLYRDNPVSHPAYAPLSKDFVATYCLATDGGNVNLRSYKPARRALNQARYDMDIALRRTRWGG